MVPAQALVPKPAALGWPEAGGLMLTGVTAWHALGATNVHEGDTVLIHGAAGGVGLMAVQLAVIAVVIVLCIQFITSEAGAHGAWSIAPFINSNSTISGCEPTRSGGPQVPAPLEVYTSICPIRFNP